MSGATEFRLVELVVDRFEERLHVWDHLLDLRVPFLFPVEVSYTIAIFITKAIFKRIV